MELSLLQDTCELVKRIGSRTRKPAAHIDVFDEVAARIPLKTNSLIVDPEILKIDFGIEIALLKTGGEGS